MRKGERGFTLVEVTIILLVLVILAAILLPMAERFIDLARLARVREDIGALESIIELFKVDTCNSFFQQDGNGAGDTGFKGYDSDNRVDMLIGDGDTPPVDGLTGNDAKWTEPYSTAAPFALGGSTVVDTISNQLALGDPFGANPGDPYRRPSNTDPNPFRCGWRGAYIQTPITADPWGNRYMINVAFLGHPGKRKFGAGNDFGDKDVFVLSAGPDEMVQTPFVVDGVVAQGDDQIAVVSGHSAF